ncbi:MAG: glycoside hydrolase family 3 C-terminal domain-containing protein [Defluviitaleaceae bacterium]|nr:glycoside hydrolase family 3 C-terminal domain-containing protein [Defluviitaleaceae bacterium]
MRTAVVNTKLTENCSKETISNFVKELLGVLTLEEKVGIMSGQVTEQKLLDDLFVTEHYNVTPYPTLAVDRLGVPNVRFVDGPRGAVSGSGTCFPVSMARGASFDRDLEEEIGKVIGAEIRALGGNYFGGVCINLPRNPRWGRAQETYGEDQYHLGEMGAALTRGVQSQNVMACVKHYAMNSIENSRFKVDVHADKRTLHEIYLPHFKRCIDEGAASVMGAYNLVYGDQACESKFLLKDILRGKWGFEGFTLSDFLWGVKDAVKAVKSGMDIDMPCISHYVNELPKAVKEGKIDIADIDESVSCILKTVLYFETRKDPIEYTTDLIACPEHIAVAKKAAQESMVLLKNDKKVLPFSKEKTEKILVLGVLGDTENIGDHGSSKVHPFYTVTPFRGLMKKMPTAQIFYNDGSNLQQAKELAADADAVVIIAGYIHSDEGEYLADRTEVKGSGAGAGGDRASMRLHKRDIDLITGLKGVNPNTVVSIIGSSAILIDEWVNDVPAVIFSFYSGMEGGNALADILFGDVCPGGKLPYTVTMDENSYPHFEADCTKADYEYYHGYCKMEREKLPVLYPFGYGLSYTTFKIGTASVDVFDDTAKFNVSVKNTGTVKGAEVMQLYVGCEGSKVDRPIKVLKDFGKLSLMPGEEKSICLSVSKKDMAYFDEGKDCFVEEDIAYIAYIGNSSAADALQILKFKFN